MAKRMWLFCLNCFDDRIFNLEYRSHGWMQGGHEDWHCTHCHECRYEVARRHKGTTLADD